MRPSMGTVGDAYDNAMAESFFATLECELIARRKWETKTKARLEGLSGSRLGTTRTDAILAWARCRPSTLKNCTRRKSTHLAHQNSRPSIGDRTRHRSVGQSTQSPK